jgi:murein DD-endopeptidase MepM/ murein hydrolase activator NlpD
MRRILAVCAGALALTGTASAHVFSVVPSNDTAAVAGADPAAAPPLSLAPGLEPNADGTIIFPVDLSLPPLQAQVLSWTQLQPLWQQAGQQYGIPWTVLAAINKVESNFGENMGPSSAGAVGWMQFMPDTWVRWGTDADGDGIADPWNPIDAIFSAARYLAATGGQTDIQQGVFAYNHAQWYVDEVLQLAQVYAGGGIDLAQSLADLQARVDAAKHAVLDANGKLIAAEQWSHGLDLREDALIAKAERANLLTERLNAQKQAVIFDGRVQQAHAGVEALRLTLYAAHAELDAARQALQGGSFSPATSSLVDSPAYSNGYVFPVGGGAGVVFVGHTHHDYPAADIAAPEGSPAYALSTGLVTWSTPEPAGNCGIGFTIDTTDGLEWTYCHLAYLEPTVVQGTQLAAGEPVGLVGETGHAEGPHLHLQLDPADAYPQEEPWFASFAGTAFTWLDSVQTNAAPAPVFAVVSDGPTAALPTESLVLFTAS